MSNWIRSPLQLLRFRKENQALKLPAMHMTAHDKAVIEKAAELLKDALTKQGSVHIMHHTGENTMQDKPGAQPANKQALQPFDLEKALAGHPVVTRDGRNIRLLITEIDKEIDWPVIFAIEGERCARSTSIDGLVATDTEHSYDLFMAPRMRTVYINQWTCGGIAVYDTAQKAILQARTSPASLIAHPVEIPDVR